MKTRRNCWQIPCKMRGHECLKYQHVANTIQKERLRCQTIWIPCKWQVLVPNCCKYRAIGTRKEIKKHQTLSDKSQSYSSPLFLRQASHPSRSPRTSLSEVRNTMGLKSLQCFSSACLKIHWLTCLQMQNHLLSFFLEIVCLNIIIYIYIYMIAPVQFYSGVRSEFISRSWCIGYSFCMCMCVCTESYFL